MFSARLPYLVLGQRFLTDIAAQEPGPLGGVVFIAPVVDPLPGATRHSTWFVFRLTGFSHALSDMLLTIPSASVLPTASGRSDRCKSSTLHVFSTTTGALHGFSPLRKALMSWLVVLLQPGTRQYSVP